MFIFVNILITSDQSMWSQPSCLIYTYQLCQHPLSFPAVTLIVTLSLNLLITFGSHRETVHLNMPAFFSYESPRSICVLNPCHKLLRKSILRIFLLNQVKIKSNPILFILCQITPKSIERHLTYRADLDWLSFLNDYRNPTIHYDKGLGEPGNKML